MVGAPLPMPVAHFWRTHLRSRARLFATWLGLEVGLGSGLGLALGLGLGLGLGLMLGWGWG